MLSDSMREIIALRATITTGGASTVLLASTRQVSCFNVYCVSEGRLPLPRGAKSLRFNAFQLPSGGNDISKSDAVEVLFLNPLRLSQGTFQLAERVDQAGLVGSYAA